MTRRFKLAGVLIVVIAAFAVVASSASASGFTTVTGNTITGVSTNNEHKLDLFGIPVKCKEVSYHGEIHTSSDTLTLIPFHKGCYAFGTETSTGFHATVNHTGCGYLFHKEAEKAGTVDISCKGSNSIDVTIYSNVFHSTAYCHMQILEQKERGNVSFVNEGGEVKLTGTIEGLEVVAGPKTSVLCNSVGTENGGKYTLPSAGIFLSGNNGAFSVD